jgi:hypothetical protein
MVPLALPSDRSQLHAPITALLLTRAAGAAIKASLISSVRLPLVFKSFHRHRIRT